MSQTPAKVFVHRNPHNTSSKNFYGTIEIPINNGNQKSKKLRRKNKSNGKSVAPTQPVPALDPRGGGRPSRSITLLSNALAKLSIDRHEPTAAQPVAKPDLVSPDAFMTAVKSIFGVPNPTAATAASTINPIGSPSLPVKGPSPASSPELKRAAKPDRGRRVFEERLLGLQASKYAPKNVAVDIDVVMGEAGDDVPDVPEPKEVPKPKEVSHARPLGLMASKWAPKK